MNKVGSLSKAFNYEDGQYICHVYIDASDHDSDYSDYLMGDLVEFLLASSNDNSKSWRPLIGDANDENCDKTSSKQNPYHISLLRGHHALYYHQIKPFIAHLSDECSRIPSFNICLDKLMIFTNHENTKRFLCLASDLENDIFNKLTSNVKLTIDKFALDLTRECDIKNSIPHCSLLWREIDPALSNDQDEELEMLNERLRHSHLSDFTKNLKVENINVKVGFKIYNLTLS